MLTLHAMDPLAERVEHELARHGHPLFRFSTHSSGSGIVLAIDLREGFGVQHHYEISLPERQVQNPQFPWTFQKLLYDCPHDFIVEMFERSPRGR